MTTHLWLSYLFTIQNETEVFTTENKLAIFFRYVFSSFDAELFDSLSG